MGEAVVSSLREGRYVFSEFLPLATASFSSRTYDAAKDIRTFLQSLGRLPDCYCTVRQVHGERIISAVAPCVEEEEAEEADGLVTDQLGLALVIRTADCVPVFFLDAETPAVGIVHAGWRGTRKGILQRMTETFTKNFGTKPSSLKIGIGPAIRECCYEVGPEFVGYFPGFVKEKEGRRLDLVGVIKNELQETGILSQSIVDSKLCTSCSVDQFFSARREGIETGRLISAIVLK